MPRERLRVCLQDGLKLDLNQLVQRGFVQRGERTGPLPIQWLNSDTGEVRPSALITANLSGHDEGSKVAYRSQFLSVYDRGHAGQAKIKSRLIGDCNPDEWDLPPKPKWMRWRTYNQLVERFDAYEDMTYPDDFASVLKLLRRSK